MKIIRNEIIKENGSSVRLSSTSRLASSLNKKRCAKIQLRFKQLSNVGSSIEQNWNKKTFQRFWAQELCFDLFLLFDGFIHFYFRFHNDCLYLFVSFFLSVSNPSLDIEILFSKSQRMQNTQNCLLLDLVGRLFNWQIEEKKKLVVNTEDYKICSTWIMHVTPADLQLMQLISSRGRTYPEPCWSRTSLRFPRSMMVDSCVFD